MSGLAPHDGAAGATRAGRAMPWVAAVVMATFINAGNMKGSPPFSVVPVDLTLLSAAVLAAIVGWRLVTGGIPFAVVPVLAGFALLAPPLLWTVAGPYPNEKALHFFLLTGLAAVGPAVLVRGIDDARRLLVAYAGANLVTVVNVLLSPQPVATYAGAPLALPGVTTIGVGQSAGFVVLFAALGLIWKQRGSPLWALALGAAGILVMLETGSRGPMLSVVVAMVVTPFALRQPLLRTLTVAGLAAVAVAALFASAPLYARERVESAASGEVAGSILIRVHLFDLARRSIGDNPLGIGWGGYEQLAPDGYRYPHNLALEVLAEAGVILGGLFLAWILLYYGWVRKAGGGFAMSVLFAGFTYALIGSTTSGDLNDNRALFMLLGASIALVHRGVPRGSPVTAGDRAGRAWAAAAGS
jgi:O-antigen ligase